jgi:hypothetical protein
MDRDFLQDQGFLPIHPKRPMLGPCGKIGILQLLDMSIFIHLEVFCHGSLSTFYSCYIGMGLNKLHFKHPGEYLGFLNSAKALPQL